MINNCGKTERKRIRLQNFSYSENGAYFITICTREKEKILGKIVGDGILDVPKTGAKNTAFSSDDTYMQLSETGGIVKQTIEYLTENNSNITIDKYVIMPNHIHLIIVINSNPGTSGKPSPTESDFKNRANDIIPKFVSSLKRFSNKQSGFQIWQRSYYDHVIRNQNDYQKIWEYIDTNPIRWSLDKYFTE